MADSAEIKPAAKAAVVAKGRTVVIGTKSFGPGSEIRLPTVEVSRLTELGFLVNPEAIPIPVGEGPTFSAKDGPSIKLAQ